MTNKFKAWDKTSEAWLKEDAVTIDGNGKVFLFGVYYQQNENIVICHEVGMEDKNGREIHESDIVDCIVDNKYEYPCTGVVEFINGHFAINVGKALLGDEQDSYAHFWSHKDFEVIGNIYEQQKPLPND